MLSMTFPMVFSRAIGRYALGFVWSGFDGFCSTTVMLFLYGVGKWPVSILACISIIKLGSIVSMFSFRTLLMIPSGPGDLFGESFRITRRSCCLVMLVSQGTGFTESSLWVTSDRSAA